MLSHSKPSGVVGNAFVMLPPDCPDIRYSRFGYVGPSSDACQSSHTMKRRASRWYTGRSSASK